MNELCYNKKENLKFRQRYQFVKGVKECSLKYLMVQKFCIIHLMTILEKYIGIMEKFRCDEQYDVVGDSLWDSIEMCMAVANTSYGGQIIWIKNEV